MLFDTANPDSSTAGRNVSTVAPQALLLLNHPFTHAQATHLAERLLREVPDDDTVRIEHAFRLMFGRPPSAEEVDIARQVIAQGAASDWSDLAHVLLCSNEFVYLD